MHRAAQWLTEEQTAGRTDPLIDPDIPSRLFVLGGMQVIAHQVAAGIPERDSDIARELANAQWYGAFRRSPPQST